MRSNTFLGYSSGPVSVGDDNTAFGYESLASLLGGLNPSGSYNTALGAWALYRTTTGYKNTAVGRAALEKNDIGYQNTAIGYGTLHANESGANNTALGMESLHDLEAGVGNTALGAWALRSSLGDYNTAVGLQAGQLGRAGNRNVYLGVNAGYGGDGDDNVALGYGAGLDNTGNGNIFLGQGADCSPGLRNVTVIGTARRGVSGDTIYLGNGQRAVVDGPIQTRAPAYPEDGDLWVTQEGVFVRVNGTTRRIDFD